MQGKENQKGGSKLKRTILVIITLLMFLAVSGCSAISIPDAEQIKSDLIGHQITVGLSGWHFDALAEFESFIIISNQQQGDALEYDVTMRLTDFQWDAHYLLDALITYKKVDGKWQLKSITPKLYKQL